ncbi:hypothetical protein K4F52_009332 [Lecanicillium sp. MT-2017a]|nr:hypothetical protein K4F52_009332 [Lecanicillium sp. MT-2017a]
MEDMTKVFASAFKSKRLSYQPIEDSDKEFMHRCLWSNPVQMGLAVPFNLQIHSRQVSDQQVDGMMKHSALAIMVLLPGEKKDGDKDEPEPERVGFVTLRSGMPCRATSVSMAIADDYQGRGYGREALNWALDWAFGYGDFHRVELTTGEYNDRAVHLYKSIGFVEEGRKRKAFLVNHKWWDTVEMGMLREDYEKARSAQGQSS